MGQRTISFIHTGYKTFFHITMDNYTINMETGVQSKSVLRSFFSREIYEIPVENVGYTKYEFLETEFMSQNKKEFKPWTFAKNAEFYSCLFCIQDKHLKREYYSEAEKERPLPSLQNSFAKFPKLPSVYLLAMQAIDVITFDAFLCMANSEFFKTEFNVKYSHIDEMAKRYIPIGTGIYSNSSYYLNDELYLRLLGETIYQETDCWIFNYSSEPSDIYMENEKVRTALKSKSLYSGIIYISKLNGDLVYGELNEHIISEGRRKKYSKRTVVIERKKEN